MNTYKPFINYFKRSDSTATVGMSMLVGGVILLWLGWSFYWLFFYFGIALIPIGFGIYLYGSTGRSDENELNKIIKKNTDAISFADIKESSEFRRRMLKNPTEETFGGYVFNDNVLMKKAKSAAMVSSEYVLAKMLILNDALFIRSAAFSFIADEKHESEIEIPFSTIEKIEIEHQTETFAVDKKEFVVKTCFLVITHEGIQTRLPRKDDIYADELVVTLNRLLKNQ
jgi:hypothetical protein